MTERHELLQNSGGLIRVSSVAADLPAAFPSVHNDELSTTMPQWRHALGCRKRWRLDRFDFERA